LHLARAKTRLDDAKSGLARDLFCLDEDLFVLAHRLFVLARRLFVLTRRLFVPARDLMKLTRRLSDLAPRKISLARGIFSLSRGSFCSKDFRCHRRPHRTTLPKAPTLVEEKCIYAPASDDQRSNATRLPPPIPFRGLHSETGRTGDGNSD
jgi:hypothetical protein